MATNAYSRKLPSGRSSRDDSHDSYKNRSDGRSDLTRRRNEEPSTVVVRPSVRRPIQIPMHCIREEVNPWHNRTKLLPARQPIKLLSSAERKVVEVIELVTTESNSETLLQSFKPSVSSGIQSGTPKPDAVETISNSCEELPIKVKDNWDSDSDSDEAPSSRRNPTAIIVSNSMTISKNHLKNVNPEIAYFETIGDTAKNVIISVEDNTEPLSVTYTSISSGEGEFNLTDLVVDTDTDAGLTSSSTNSPSSGITEENQYGLIGMMANISVEGMRKNPMGSLLSTGYCCHKLLEGLGNPATDVLLESTYKGPFSGGYEDVDHDNYLEIEQLATTSPQCVNRKPISIIADIVGMSLNDDGTESSDFYQESEMRSIILSQYSFYDPNPPV